MYNSLLESYIHVVYENKNKVEQKFFEKYFSAREKFCFEKKNEEKIAGFLNKSLSNLLRISYENQ